MFLHIFSGDCEKAGFPANIESYEPLLQNIQRVAIAERTVRGETIAELYILCGNTNETTVNTTLNKAY